MIATILVKYDMEPATIGILLGIDRILDMSRTTLNVVGDMTIAACVNGMEERSQAKSGLTPTTV